MCKGIGDAPPDIKAPELPDLPDVRIGRVIRRYSVYSHFYFIEVTFAGIAPTSVCPIIIKEDVCPAHTYPRVRPGDIVRVWGQMESHVSDHYRNRCFEAREIDYHQKWDADRFGRFQYIGYREKGEAAHNQDIVLETRKLVLGIQCQSDVLRRVHEYLRMTLPEGFDVEESTTPVALSQDRLLLVWRHPSAVVSGKKISDQILADPILMYAVSRVYNIDKVRTYQGVDLSEALCEWSNNNEISGHKIRVHAFPKFIDMEEVNALITHQNCSLSPKDFTHVMTVLYANGTFFISYLEKAAATACGLHLSQDSNAACLSVSKAAAKILEAMSRMDRIPALADRANVAGKTAMDVGASPGGWSYFLRTARGCSRVIAVDKGPLADPCPPGVGHFRMKGEDAVSALLQTDTRLGIYTCDMNVTLVETVELFLRALPLMAHDSVAVLTFKRTEKNKAKWEELKNTGHRLLQSNPRIDFVHEVHLIANTPNETTVLIGIC